MLDRAAFRWLRPLALAAVLLAAATLALAWVFLVPVYQAPDEPMNLDYAWSINQNRALFRVHHTSYRELPDCSHPQTVYLARRIDPLLAAFNPRARMPREYGTLDYFLAVDREAPPRDATPIAMPNKPFAVYPYGYYSLLAVWIGGLHLIHDGPVFVFFGARIMSVVLLMISLLSIDATLRRLGIGRWKSLVLTGAIGCFPLTSFVASAIQMDNLTFTLVSLSFWLALVVRDEPERRGAMAFLGIALGALLVTKVHFFLCITVPIVLMLATRSVPGGRRTWKHRLETASLLIAPSLVTGSIYLWSTWGTTNYYAPTGERKDVLLDVLDLAKAATIDFYAGATHESFWGRFGWMDTPLVVHGRATTAVINFILQALAWVFLGLTLLRLEQVTSRLIRLACAGRARLALQMACSNPLINSYFLFTVFMFAIYIHTSNRFGAQGRNWFPLLLPIFLTGLVYAPKALSLGWTRRAFTRAILAGLVLYCTVGSFYALRTIERRYYLPRHSPFAYVLGKHPQARAAE